MSTVKKEEPEVFKESSSRRADGESPEMSLRLFVVSTNLRSEQCIDVLICFVSADCYLVDLYSQLTQLQAGITQEKIAGHSQLGASNFCVQHHIHVSTLPET